MTDLPGIPFADVAALEAWFVAEHDRADELLLRVAKKGSGIPSVTTAQALELALCFGWIDAIRRGVDAEWFLQRYTPRRARSKWSQINCASAERLIAAGQMQPAGQREVDRAKGDGRWDAAYASPANITVPPDLEAALAAAPGATAAFAALKSSDRYAVLYQVHDAKRPETRERRIAKFVAQLADAGPSRT